MNKIKLSYKSVFNNKLLVVFFLVNTVILNYTGNASENTVERAAEVSSNSVSGYISLTGKQASKAKVRDVIVYFEPENSVYLKPLEKPFSVKMKNKSYIPRVSAIPVGTEIRISNHDQILHNAFSLSRPNQFDLGLYRKSEGKSHRFKHAGVVRIFCNVHYHMVAYVLVLNTPHHARVDENGFFELTNLPNGKGQLFVWHERAKKYLKKISIPYAKTIDIKLPITKRRIPIHKNKSGKSYKKKRRRRRY